MSRSSYKRNPLAPTASNTPESEPDPEFTHNSDIDIPDQVADFGDLLRTLRNNHGYTLHRFAKMIGLSPEKISRIELSKGELPPENVLRMWFLKLGCGATNLKKLILISRQYRTTHYVKLQRKELANPDILRLLAVYKNNKLNDYDRSLLKLIARG